MLNFPQNPNIGDVFQRWIWDGDKWVTVAGAVGSYLPITGGTMIGPITLNGNATAPLQPTTLQQVEGMQPDLSGLATTIALTNGLATKLNLTGGTMSGPIVLPADGSGSQAVRYSQLAAVTAPYLLLAGGDMTGPITLNADGSGSQAIRYSQLGAYSTTAQMNTAIGTAIGAIPPTDLTGVLHLTGGNMTGPISLNADGSGSQAIRYSQLANYPTTAAMNTAISTAIGAIPSPDMSKYDPVPLVFSFAALPSSGIPSGAGGTWQLSAVLAIPVTIPVNPEIRVYCNVAPAAAITLGLWTRTAANPSNFIQQGSINIPANTPPFGPFSPSWTAGVVLNLVPGDVVICVGPPDASVSGLSVAIKAMRT